MEKLIRDKIIPNPSNAKVRLVENSAELRRRLRRKLVEEALEALDAEPGQALLIEMADVLEALHGLADANNFSWSSVEETRAARFAAGGGFYEGRVLIWEK